MLQARAGTYSYDYVIVGSGPHGIITAHRILRFRPDASILMIDQGDTPGGTFGLQGDTFSINSSSRSSSDLPLPGRGNINELPNLPIQVTDLSAQKYASGGDLGRALVAGLYTAANSYAQGDDKGSYLDLAFDARVNSIKHDSQSDRYILSSIFKPGFPNKTAELFRVDAASVIIASGLGESKLPPKGGESNEV